MREEIERLLDSATSRELQIIFWFIRRLVNKKD